MRALLATGRAARMGPVPLVVAALAVAVLASALGLACWPARSSGARYDQSLDVGCDPGIDKALRAWADEGFAGSIAARGGVRECVAGYGLADRATGREMTPDTAFDIASVTKAVTAAAVFDLIDRGELSLDETAGQHVDGLSGPIAEVDIRNLLLHSSGLIGAYHGHDHEPLSETEAVEVISSMDIGYEPGTEYLYSNANYTLLALVIESVAGSYRDYVATSRLVNGNGEPIGGFWDGEPPTPGPRAVGYLTPGGEAGHMGGFAGPHWALDGGGAIGMTPSELAEWTRALFSGEIISDRAVAMLMSTTSHLAGEAVELPGWGRLDRDLIGVDALATAGGGDAIGHVVDVVWLPGTGEVIVLAQSAGSWQTGSIAGDTLLPLGLGTGIPGPPQVPEVDPAAVEAMVGPFRLDDGDRLVITENGPGLQVTAEGPDAMAALFPIPDGLRADVERHQRQALSFIEGSTADGQRERQHLERDHGTIAGIDLVGTIASGGMSTLFEVAFEPSGQSDQQSHQLVAVSLNRFGGNEGVGVTSWPKALFVADGSGGLRPYGAGPDDPRVSLDPVGGGVDITGPGGTVLATTEGAG
jgi:CubicO group peptidase (beta-lactamase class C family)